MQTKHLSNALARNRPRIRQVGLGTSIGVYGYAQYVEVYDKIARYPLSRESLVLGSNRSTRQSTEPINRASS
ncbi:MAG: hypothetical protein ACREXY_16165 [Gammaproteobacteria bacterium]